MKQSDNSELEKAQRRCAHEAIRSVVELTLIRKELEEITVKISEIANRLQGKAKTAVNASLASADTSTRVIHE